MFPVKGKSHLKMGYVGRSHLDIEATCPNCKKPERLTVPTAGFSAWTGGKLIQDALPDLNDTQREQLMTGYCQPCWDEMWAEEEEEPIHG